MLRECGQRRQFVALPDEFLKQHVDDVRQLCLRARGDVRHDSKPFMGQRVNNADADKFAQYLLVPRLAARPVIALDRCAGRRSDLEHRANMVDDFGRHV